MAHVYKFMFYSLVELKLKINTRSLFNRTLNPAHPTLPSGPLLALSVFIGAGQPLQHGEVRDTNLAWVGPVVQSLATMLTRSWRSSGQDVWHCGFGMANSKSGYYNLFSSCEVLEFLGWPKWWFQEIKISTMYRHIPLDLNLLLDIGIHRLQICIVNSCQWVYVMVKGLLC